MSNSVLDASAISLVITDLTVLNKIQLPNLLPNRPLRTDANKDFVTGDTAINEVVDLESRLTEKDQLDFQEGTTPANPPVDFVRLFAKAIDDSLYSLTSAGVETKLGGGGGSGTVTQVDTGVGLTGGPITTTGTIDLENTTVSAGSFTSADITVDAQGRLTAAANGAGGGTVTQVNTGTGLTGGPITASGTIDLENTTVVAGSFTIANITVDAQGRLTSAANGSAVTQVNTGTGLTGGPITASGTIDLENTTVSAGSFTNADITVDAQGRLTAAANGSGGSGTVTQVNTGTGLTGGPITTSGTIDLDNTTVVAGSFTIADITVDAQGRLTAAANGSAVTQVATGVGLTGGPITTTGTIDLENTTVSAGSFTNSDITVDAQGRITAAANGSAGSGTVTQVNTGTGLTGGPITTSGTIDLDNTTVVAGSFTIADITVDAQGRLTAAANGSAVTQVNTGTGLTGGPITGSGTIDLDNTTVVAGSFTSANITVDAQGRLTAAANGAGGGTVTQVNTGTGLTGGPITGSGTIDLENTTVSAGSFTSANITVDAQGRLTAAANGAGGGTVTQVNTGVGLTGGPITASGTIDLENTAVTPGSFTNADITVDAQGRLTAAATGSGVSGSFVIVKIASDLTPPLDSTKLYRIDAAIDMGTQTIEVPSGGLTICGWSVDISSLFSSSNTYSMFTSEVGGSGSLIVFDVTLSVTGTSSEIFNLIGLTGLEQIRMTSINFIDCTSLGVIEDYAQALENITVRRGGTPNLTLAGSWVGYFIDTAGATGMLAGMTGALYQADVGGFTMTSRFVSNQGINLPALAAFVDFAPANFPNDSTLQLQNCIISRNDVFDATDTNLTPNIAASDLSSDWRLNNGIPNTFIGGQMTVTVAITTTITIIGTPVFLAGTWTTSDLQHFDSPANGQLRHLGASPLDYIFRSDLQVQGPGNDLLTITVRKFDFSTTTTSDVASQTRQVINAQGGVDFAIFSIFTGVQLAENDFVFLEIQNDTSTGDVTAQIDSFSVVLER